MPDWKTDSDGDLVMSNGSISVTADESETAKQNIYFRLRTGLLDYEPEPDLGAGLDQYIGKQNTASTGAAVKRAVTLSLTRDGTFPANALYIEVVPLSYHVLGVYVFYQPRFSGTSDPVTITATYDLTTGTVSQLDGSTV